MRAHSPIDMHPADIKAALAKKGLTLVTVSFDAGLPDHACKAALRGKSRQGEDAIARALGLAPETIWPSRFAKARRMPNRSRAVTSSRLRQK